MNEAQKGNNGKNTNEEKSDALSLFFDIVEILGYTTIAVMLVFAFVVRLNIVDGQSMLDTLKDREFLAVSDLGYEPEAGDIVIVHNISAVPYSDPIVKRVIATEGDHVEIDFSTWTLKINGEEVEEKYRRVDSMSNVLTAEYGMTDPYHFEATVPENCVFVMGDNRNHSADSRQSEIQMVDKRCVVGKALVRIFPISRFNVFKNPLK